jgi:hypothetical protein
LLGLLALIGLGLRTAGHAQGQVKIVGVVLSVKHRVGPTGAFIVSRVGAQLPAGSRVQTGARSKCALQFPGGGIVRMGERSDLIIQNPTATSVKLGQGKLWAKVLAGTTASVEGSHGVAVVKGTEWTFDGETITCYDGDVDYQTQAGTTAVPLGYSGTADAAGAVTREPAPGRQYPGGDLIQWFGGLRIGEEIAVTAGESPGAERKQTDFSVDTVVGEATTPGTGGLDIIITGTDTAAARGRAARMVDPLHAPAAWGQFPGVDPNTLAPLSISRPMGFGFALPEGRLGQVPELPDRGYLFGPYTPADAFGYATDGGGTLGLRVRPHVVLWDSIYVEVGATARTSHWYGDGTDITEAFATWRPDWGELSVGRQHFLEGPVNNTRLGSLVAFDTGDAARAKTHLGRLGVDAAYVRKMGPVIGPGGRGWYGRLDYPVQGGIVGLNGVYLESADDMGFSLDAAMPVIERRLDLYGEVGNDPLDRSFFTVGAYFPALYQRHDIDLFLEHAERDGLPSVTTLRLYKHVGEDLTCVFSADKQSGDSLNVGVGAIWRFGD